MPTTPTHPALAPRAAALMLAAFAGFTPAQAASPAFVNPLTIDARQPFTLTAVSPSTPYRIDGFAGGVDGLLLYKINAHQPTLRPPMWRTQPGQTIGFELRNQLPCTPSSEPGKMRPDQTNVHVHGLIVQPNAKTAAGSYGDNAMLVVDSVNKGCLPPNAAMPMTGMPHEAGGSASFQVKLPADHPYGLSWYHPHVHEVAGLQVGSGMSGLIAIGNVWQYAYAQYASVNVRAANERSAGNAARRQTELALRQHTQELHLMLKDLQLVQTQASPARYRYSTPLDPGLCGSNPAPQGLCSNAAGDAKWLFMVNGQLFPTITVKRGDRHVWRMANVGATVSYKLRLRVTAPAASAGTIVPLQVLVSDGVPFEQLKAQANWQDSVTMMPSARAEVHVDPMHVCRVLAGRPASDHSPCTLPQDVVAVLETSGIQTGADAWPDAGLAQVRIQAVPTYVAANDPGPMGVSTVSAPGAVPTPTVADTTPACANPSTLLPKQYRLIGVKNEVRPEGEFFGMATLPAPGTLDANGKPPLTTLAASDYQAFDAHRVDLCIGANIQAGYTERWVIKNDATEIHNFHVHQAKFKVLDFDASVPLLVPMRTGKNVLHDNFPVNPGQWVMVEVKFDHPQQVGKYMYHCHILEHEDKGMMSVIQVVDTSVPVAAVPGSVRSKVNAPRMPMASALASNDPTVAARDEALARYRASAPAWMTQSVCLPASKGLRN